MNLHEYAGRFVHEYTQIFRPCLISGETEGLGGAILDEIERLKMTCILGSKNGVFARCLATLMQLYPLTHTKPCKRVMELITLSSDRYVNEICLILNGDDKFEKHRGGK